MNFFNTAANQDNPLRPLNEFLKNEKQCEQAKKYDEMRFVGYVLDIGYENITVITSDPFKIAVGGIPRNSLLIMCPSDFDGESQEIPLHFTLLRVLDSAPTPLSSEVQQTYFELQKKSMPELDQFTQSELQWGALKTSVLGMFYLNPENRDKIEFSGDLNNYVSAHKYKVFAPNEELLDLVHNTLLPNENRFIIGKLRLTECRLAMQDSVLPNVDISLSTNDFLGCRTAMFGKTRLGKSNVVKLVAQSLLETTKESKNVGQIIFDINGEYANDNPQDGNTSIRSAYPDRCIVYALTKKDTTPSKELKINFYQHPKRSHAVIRTLLNEKGRSSIYIEKFLSVNIPDIEELKDLDFSEKTRAKRKILMYWSILQNAGFEYNEAELNKLIGGMEMSINKEASKICFGEDETQWPQPKTLQEVKNFLETVTQKNYEKKLPSSTSGNDLFDSEDLALLGFLSPQLAGSAGTGVIQGIKKYHSKNAGDFIKEILGDIDLGNTLIIDLGNADEEVMQYFSRELSEAIFYHQTDKFTNNKLNNHYVQLYFEEAHNLFKDNDTSDSTKIYRRFAKEGAKYHIGMVYSTQSPTTINADLLAQTENFFIAHLSSQDDVNKLAKINTTYENIKSDILRAKTPGFIRMLTRSHRFVVSLQANKFQPHK